MSDPAIARNGQWTALASMFDHIPREGRNNPYRVAVFVRPGPHDLGIGRQSARRRVKGFGAGTQIARSRPAGEAQPPASNLTPTIRLSRAAFAGDDNSDAVCRNRAYHSCRCQAPLVPSGRHRHRRDEYWRRHSLHPQRHRRMRVKARSAFRIRPRLRYPASMLPWLAIASQSQPRRRPETLGRSPT